MGFLQKSHSAFFRLNLNKKIRRTGMPNGSKQTICPCQGSLIIRNGPMKRNNYRIGPLKN